MKEKDAEKRSTKKYTNPVTPRYLKPKYKIPDELKVRRESSEDPDESTKSTKTASSSLPSGSSSAKDKSTPISSTKSDGIVHASRKPRRKKSTKKKPSKKGKKKKKEVEERQPERSDSYLNVISQYAIAGRKVKRKPAQRAGTLDQVRSVVIDHC